MLEEDIPFSCRLQKNELHLAQEEEARGSPKRACKATRFDFRALEKATGGFWIPWSQKKGGNNSFNVRLISLTFLGVSLNNAGTFW